MSTHWFGSAGDGGFFPFGSKPGGTGDGVVPFGSKPGGAGDGIEPFGSKPAVGTDGFVLFDGKSAGGDDGHTGACGITPAVDIHIPWDAAGTHDVLFGHFLI